MKCTLLIPTDAVVFLADGKCPEIFWNFNNTGLHRVDIKYALACTSPDGIKF